MKAFVALLAAVLLATACSDPIQRAFAHEKVRPVREISNVQTERDLILKTLLHSEAILSEGIIERKALEDTPVNRGTLLTLQDRLESVRRSEVTNVAAFDALVKQRVMGDRIFWVHSLTEATGWYALVRGDRIIARGETEYFIE